MILAPDSSRADNKTLRFTKMHGLGNDFMVIDGVTQDVHLTAAQIQRWADRNFGIGFDQLLLVEPPAEPNVDFRYRIFNADGDEVEHCGNGARCFARFVLDQGLTHKRVIRVAIQKGMLELHVHDDNTVTVDMGKPQLQPQDIPFIAEKQQSVYPLLISEHEPALEISAISMGNPHCVILVNDLDKAPVQVLGPLVENHDAFPKRCNVGFLQILNRHEGRLRVFERGVGETLACGTGACAAMVAGRLRGLFDTNVTLHLLGGDLEISWSGDGSVLMTGPATKVFEGYIPWNNPTHN
ncbi:diaminopimelate epimerase [Gynuella sp.]|uniref:diaminopimelate epimerase n=2 Tax=Gynuella sp. TaxID=2969146 RepID=UPI003D10FC0E